MNDGKRNTNRDSAAWRAMGCWSSIAWGVALMMALWVGLGRGHAIAGNAVTITDEEPAVTNGATVITAQRLEFDNRARVAVFTGNVLVRDATLRMRADRLTVTFDEAEQPARIEALGNVVILQGDRLARSQSAVYDLAAGKMVLTGAAEVRRGRDLLKGDTVTFWRDQDRIEVVPGTLVIAPESRRENQSLMGP